MRNIFLYLILWFSPLTLLAQSPDWVTNHPVSNDAYHGVGVSSINESDYVKVATDNALADIASQISMRIENSSFFQMVDVDGHSREMFNDKIQKKLTAWLEGQKLVESYQSADSYYVYYTLDKVLYQKNTLKRRNQAISLGKDFLNNGKAAEANMDLAQALQLYTKGLEAIEPWLFMNLVSDGVNIPVELYNAYVNVFSGLSLTTNVNQVEGENFKPIATAISACLSKNGQVVPNVILQASFQAGSGSVSAPMATDHTGTATFYIKGITSKKSVQELIITLDHTFIASLPEAYKQLMKNKSWPSAKVMVVLKNQPVTAYYLFNEESDIQACNRPLRSLLGNKFFALTDDPDAAQCFIDISTSLDMGDVVTGGIYDLNTCLCTLHLKIFNNQTQQLLLDYSINDHRVLVPTSKSESQVMSMCARELMKVVNRELPRKIKNIEMFK